MSIEQRAFERGDVAAATLSSGSMHARAELIAKLDPRTTLGDEAVSIAIDPSRLANAPEADRHISAHHDVIELSCAATKVRRRHQLRLVIPGSEQPLARSESHDEKLVALITEAHAAKRLMLAQRGEPLGSVAAAEKRCRKWLTQLMSLFYLAPDIVIAILAGHSRQRSPPPPCYG